MRDPFMYKTTSGRTIGDILFRPLKVAGINLTIVDVGARNGMFLIPPSYATQSNFIGFEPNPEEYNKLVTRNTDAIRLGHSMPYFKSEKYYDCALWNKDGTYPFYITNGTGSCTMMGKANSRVTKRMWLKGDEKDYEERYSTVKTIIPMKCRRLDNIINPLMKIDFLKIDAEGADFAILEGSESLLKSQNILFVKTEFQCFPYYDTHPLLGDQQIYLNKHGLRLIDIDLEHPKYSRDKTKIISSAFRECIFGGDAYFIVDPDVVDLSALDLQRLACVCMIFGFNSLAMSLVRDAKLLNNDDIEQIEITLNKKWTKQRFLNVWNQVPFKAAKILRKLKIRGSTVNWKS